MKKTIDFCIPYTASGIKCLEYLLHNIKNTASYFNRIQFHVSYHTDEDLKALKASSIFSWISNVYRIEPYSKELKYWESANHSLAVNTLAANCLADYIIISDFDMAFLMHGWDCKIESILKNGSSCAGIPYPNASYPRSLGSNNPNVFVSYYQNLPNLSFFATSKVIFDKAFKGVFTTFNEFLLAKGYPCRLINTPHLAKSTNLSIGSLQWLDTGWEIPEVLNQHSLSSYVFKTANANQVNSVFNLTSEVCESTMPDCFVTNESEIFIAHFIQASIKMKTMRGKEDYDHFIKKIDAYLLT